MSIITSLATQPILFRECNMNLDMPQVYTSPSFSVPAGGSGALQIYTNNATNPYFGAPYNGNSPSQIGLLFLYTNGKTGQESSSLLIAP